MQLSLENKKDALSLLFLTLITLISYYPLMLMEPNAGLGESRSFFTFPIEWVKQSLIQYHVLPLWENATTSGASIIGNPCFQLFYPIFYISLLFQNALVGLRFDFLFHLVFAAWSMYLFARVVGGSRGSAVLAAMGLVLSLPTVGKVMGGIVCETHGLAMTPLTLACVWKGLRDQNLKYFILGGALLAVQILSANVYIFIFAAMGACFIFAYFFLTDRNRFSSVSLLFYFRGFFIFFILAIGIAAVQLLPMLEFKVHSNRDSILLEDAEFRPQDQPSLAALWQLFQTLHGSWATFIFLFFALAGLLKSKRSVGLFWGTVMLIFFVAARGPSSPVDLFAFFYYVIPGLKSNDHPAKFLFMVYLCLSILAALGFTYFQTQLRRFFPEKMGLIIGVGLLSLFIVGASLTVIQRWNAFREKGLQLPLEKEKEINSQLALSFQKEEKENFRVYSDIMAVSYGYTALLYHYQLVNFTYYSQKVKTYTPYDYLVFYYPYPKPYSEKDIFKILGVLNTKYVVTQPNSELTRLPFLKPVLQETGVVILENEYFLPRFFSATKAILLIGENSENEFGSNESKLIAYHPDFNPKTMIVIRGESPFLEDYFDKNLTGIDAIFVTRFKEKNKGAFSLLKQKCEAAGVSLYQLNYRVKDYGKFASSIPDMDRAVWSLDSESNEKVTDLLKSFKNHSSEPLLFSFEKYTPNEVLIRFEIKEPNRFVAFSESYFPGWEATLDGTTVPIYLANAFIRGVFVKEAGEHLLIFKYLPKSFFVGGAISCLSLIAAIVGWRKL